MPLITVIIPVYNVELYLTRCIDSVLVQTFTDYELILVDDGSPDKCGVICDEYAQKDKRIHVIHQENGGLSAARNAGIDWALDHSNSEWLTFIDSDDWVVPEYLEFLLRGAKETGLNVVIGEYKETKGESLAKDNDSYHVEVWNTEKFYCEHVVTATVAWGKLYRKECFQTIRYPVGRLHEDEFFTYKILFKYEKIAYINHQLYYYYLNSLGIIRTPLSINRRKDIIDSCFEQVVHFSRYKFSNAELLRLNTCFATIEKYYKEVDKKEEKFHCYLKKIERKLLIKNLKKYPIGKNTQKYKIAFPLIYYLWKKLNHFCSILE